jgi:uncharacterized protein (TIGR02246 family)
MGRLLIGLAVLVALIATVGGSQGSSGRNVTLQEQALYDFYYRFTTGWNQADPGRMARLWAKDGDHISADGRVAKGRSAIEALFADQLNTTYRGSRLSLTLDSIRFISPEVAIATGGFELSGIRSGEGGTPVTMKGLHTDIWSVQDGEWQIVASRSLVPLTAARAQAQAPPADDANASLAFESSR